MTASTQLAYLLELRTAALEECRRALSHLARESVSKELRIRALEEEAEELRADEQTRNDLFCQVCPTRRGISPE